MKTLPVEAIGRKRQRSRTIINGTGILMKDIEGGSNLPVPSDFLGHRGQPLHKMKQKWSHIGSRNQLSQVIESDIISSVDLIKPPKVMEMTETVYFFIKLPGPSLLFQQHS